MSILVLLFATVCIGQKRKQPALQQNLQADFEAYNNEYFGGELPTVSVLYIDEGPNADIGDTVCTLSKQSPMICTITINSYDDRNEREADLTLFHETCHVYTYQHGTDDFDPHGPHWQACMHQLADEKAFDTLW